MLNDDVVAALDFVAQMIAHGLHVPRLQSSGQFRQPIGLVFGHPNQDVHRLEVGLEKRQERFHVEFHAFLEHNFEGGFSNVFVVVLQRLTKLRLGHGSVVNTGGSHPGVGMANEAQRYVLLFKSEQGFGRFALDNTVLIVQRHQAEVQT